MSTKEDLTALREETLRFLTKLEAVIDAEWAYTHTPPPRLSGATKRASLDLTRALADYRAGRPIHGKRR